jgi:uncharacterized protein (UPF0276 family)
LKALGVGVVYFPGLETVLQAGEDLIDVVEIEPATIWYKRSDGHFHVNRKALDFFTDLPFHKLIHGVGFPVGGTIPPGSSSFRAMRETAGRLQPEFVSEHLSFNKVRLGQTVADTGFLLPPLQSAEGVNQSVANILLFKREINLPFAFETPANYLKPLGGEMGDGEFFAQIATQADCGILLDLHNLWCNQLNGRQKLMDVVDSLPLDRVWEVHLAGGDWLDGYWLDGHSDLIPGPLREIAREVIPRLKNLKAFNFEIMPEYLQAKNLAVDDILGELEFMRELWCAPKSAGGKEPQLDIRPDGSTAFTPAQWEEALMLSIMGGAGKAADHPLTGDHGVVIYQKLVEKIRAGMFASTLPLTFRYLLLTIGEEKTMTTAREFWSKTTPKLFSSEEAMQYELANHKAQIENCPQTITLGFNPDSMFPMLGRGRLPNNIERGCYEVNITV